MFATSLKEIRAQTLVCHASKDGNAAASAGREVAEGIAGARFIELDSAEPYPAGRRAGLCRSALQSGRFAGFAWAPSGRGAAERQRRRRAAVAARAAAPGRRRRNAATQ